MSFVDISVNVSLFVLMLLKGHITPVRRVLLYLELLVARPVYRKNFLDYLLPLVRLVNLLV